MAESLPRKMNGPVRFSVSNFDHRSAAWPFVADAHVGVGVGVGVGVDVLQLTFFRLSNERSNSNRVVGEFGPSCVQHYCS